LKVVLLSEDRKHKNVTNLIHTAKKVFSGKRTSSLKKLKQLLNLLKISSLKYPKERRYI
jgi:hypothetical protein